MLKIVTLLVFISLPLMALAGDATESAKQPNSATTKQDHGKVEEQIRQKKLENLFRRLVNHCDPFPKCL